MKKSDFRYFYKQNYLNTELHKSMLSHDNQWANKTGITITENEQIFTNIDSTDICIKNYCQDQRVIESVLPQPLVGCIRNIRQSLTENGAKNPKLRHIATLVDPEVNPRSKAYGWHKDYNIEKDIKDEKKLWLTFLILSEKEINSKFVVSPTPEGLGFWNIGMDLTLETNLLIAHTLNLGHNYIEMDKNELSLIYMRWYESE